MLFLFIQLAPHWPLSPIKGPPKPKKPQFLELAFSDNEEGDDEYEPTKDELEVCKKQLCSRLITHLLH